MKQKTIYKSVMSMTKEEASYLTGIIDGEETITLTRIYRGENRRLSITITSTEKVLLEWILNATGVEQITNKCIQKFNHAPSFVYSIYSQQALDALKQVSPYLQSYKKERAKLAIKYYKKLTPRNEKYTDKLLKDRERFIKRFFNIKANA